MPYGYNQIDIENAKEDVQRGKYDAAARMARNAKTAIEQHARIDHHSDKEQFDRCHDVIQREVEKSNPSEGDLISALNRMGRFMENMEETRSREENW